MRANLDATNGLLFADAAAALLTPHLGRKAAHELLEHAANEVRRHGEALQAILQRHPALRDAKLDISPAFDLAPAIAAAGPWVDRALQDAARVRGQLQQG
jgi:3-carboxy-cis,cis-muconate cycloisomerase